MLPLTQEDIESWMADAPTIGDLYDSRGEYQLSCDDLLQLCRLALVGLGWSPSQDSAAIRAATFEEATKIVNDIVNEAPSPPYDGGSLQEGWRMACQLIAIQLHAKEKKS